MNEKTRKGTDTENFGQWSFLNSIQLRIVYNPEREEDMCERFSHSHDAVRVLKMCVYIQSANIAMIDDDL